MGERITEEDKGQTAIMNAAQGIEDGESNKYKYGGRISNKMKVVDWYLTDKGITFAGTYDMWATSMIEAEASRRKKWEKESGMNNREDDKQNKLDKANNKRRKIAENPWAESRI